MAKIRFLTKSSVEGNLVTMYLRLAGPGGLDIIAPTAMQVFPEYWNNKGQAFKQRILFNDQFTAQDKHDLEVKLSELKDYVMKEYINLNGQKPTGEWLRKTISDFYGVKENQPSETLRQYIRRFYEEAKAGTRLANAGNSKRRYSYESLRSLRGTMLSFEMFMDEKNRKSNWNDISIDWYNDFLKFYYDRGCCANYIGKHVKNLKTIMRYAREEGLHQNTEIERKSFKALSEPSDNIYLTDSEVNAMFKKDLSDSPVLARVRDIFLCGVYTAQRYSDYSRINKSMIKEETGVKYIELIQQKTGEKCLIPIRPELETILQRYDYSLPKSYEQKVNENIKTVGQKCDIKENITLEQWKSGMKVKKTVPKYKLIKTHTARRTGCTLMYLAGVQPIDIMKISGHKTEKEFLKYIKVGKMETAMNLARHPYFLGNPLSIAK
jgi:hypothetical protein